MENDVNGEVRDPAVIITQGELKELRQVLVRSIKKIDCILTNPRMRDKEMEDRILSGLCEYYGITLPELRRYKRNPELVERRQVAAYLLKTHTKRTLAQIAKVLGYRNHGTVLHHVNEVSDKLSDDFYSDKKFKKTYHTILNYLEL